MDPASTDSRPGRFMTRIAPARYQPTPMARKHIPLCGICQVRTLASLGLGFAKCYEIDFQPSLSTADCNERDLFQAWEVIFLISFTLGRWNLLDRGSRRRHRSKILAVHRIRQRQVRQVVQV